MQIKSCCEVLRKISKAEERVILQILQGKKSLFQVKTRSFFESQILYLDELYL